MPGGVAAATEPGVAAPKGEAADWANEKAPPEAGINPVPPGFRAGVPNRLGDPPRVPKPVLAGVAAPKADGVAPNREGEEAAPKALDVCGAPKAEGAPPKRLVPPAVAPKPEAPVLHRQKSGASDTVSTDQDRELLSSGSFKAVASPSKCPRGTRRCSSKRRRGCPEAPCRGAEAACGSEGWSGGTKRACTCRWSAESTA